MISKITSVKVEPIVSSQYVRPMRFHFNLDGVQRTWDILRLHDSVQIILYHKDRRALVFVKQFRPSVYLTRVPLDKNGGYDSIDWSQYPSSLGYTFELCAGILDKDKSAAETAREEVLEECGFDVPLKKIERVTSYRSGIGVTGASATMFYAEIDDSMKVSEGGGVEDETIVLEYVPVENGKERLLYDEGLQRPSSLLFGVMWFYDKKYAALQK